MDKLLSIEPGMLIWTWITFGLLMLILKKMAWKPLLAALSNREETIRTDLQSAERARVEAETLLAEHKSLLDNSELDARKIIEDAKTAAETMKQSIVDQAGEQSRQMLDQAKAEIQREKETALSQLRLEVTELAIGAASKLLDEELTGERQKKIVDDFISEFPKN